MSFDPATWATLMVAAPALAGVAALLLRWTPRQTSALTVGATALSLVSAAGLLRLHSGGVVTVWRWAPDLHVVLSWRLEVASLALAILVAGVGLGVLQYAGSYFAADRDSVRTIALLAVFESAMLGLVLADNLLLLYVFWELTGLCSFFLISSDRSKGEAGLRAASQALLVTVAGGLSMLIGILYLVTRTGTASLRGLLDTGLEPQVATVALALILPAVLTKSAQVPTHFWLPGAMAAPTPVSAYLHSATMVKAGIILLLYLYPLLGGSLLWSYVLVPAGAVTCVWGSLRALGESDIKLLMAWSTVSQLGLITLTIGLGTDVAIRAAVLHLFAHAVFKAGLFLTVGGIDHSAHTRSLFELGGLRRRLPLLAVVAAVLAGSMAGIPPLAGFLSKELILKKAMLADLWTHSVAIGAIVIGSIGTVAYTSRFFFEVFTGKPRSEGAAAAHRVPVGLLLAPSFLAGVTLLAGPSAGWVDRWFLEPVAFSVVGRPLEVKTLSLWYGINAALVLSVLIVSIGYLIDRWLGLRFIRAREARWWHGAELFEAMMKRWQRVGALVVRGLAGASPRVYLALAIALGWLPGLLLAPALRSISWRSAVPAGSVVVLSLAVLLVFLVTVRTPLARVLILTAVGFAVALLFRFANGPDLMLTQLLVEVLVTIFFALALAAVPAKRVSSPPSAQSRLRWVRVGLATAAGFGAAAWVAAMAGSRADSQLADFIREEASVIAQGTNLVNVVLTDVRSLDTLMETLVVVLGALGVVGLVKGFERADQGRRLRGETASALSGLLPGLAKVIVPIGVLFAVMMLLKGHNAPGGGFVAGLSLGVTAMIALVAFGPVRFARRLRVCASTVAIVGCVVMLLSGGLGALGGDPYLTQLHGKLSLGGLKVPLHTTLIFDLGVMLAVAGGITAAGLALWTIQRPELPGEAP